MNPALDLQTMAAQKDERDKVVAVKLLNRRLNRILRLPKSNTFDWQLDRDEVLWAGWRRRGMRNALGVVTTYEGIKISAGLIPLLFVRTTQLLFTCNGRSFTSRKSFALLAAEEKKRRATNG